MAVLAYRAYGILHGALLLGVVDQGLGVTEQSMRE